MENFTRTVTQLLEKKLALYRELSDVLSNDRTLIIDMDVEALWQTTQQKKELASRIEAVKMDLTGQLTGQGPGLGGQDRPTRLPDVVNRLDLPCRDKDAIKSLWFDIEQIKKDLTMRSTENRRYLTEYLGVIDDIFTTVALREDEKKYSPSGRMVKDNTPDHYIRAEV